MKSRRITIAMIKPITIGSVRVRTGQAKSKQRAEEFVAMCNAPGLRGVVREFKFWPDNRSAFDFAWPQRKVALESEGGSWSGGRHTRGEGFRRDCRKYSEGAIRGWLIVRVLSEELCTEETLQLVRRALASRALVDVRTR